MDIRVDPLHEPTPQQTWRLPCLCLLVGVQSLLACLIVKPKLGYDREDFYTLRPAHSRRLSMPMLCAPVIAHALALMVEVEVDDLKPGLDLGIAPCFLLEGAAQDALAAALIRQVHC